eukprot:Tamp_11524.p1 GENE.Tamp_11524~~Tamp_11524.p1  ORF type:complete len:393 (-),score=36.75 Tamp_11524:635-1813(-)
MSGRMGVRRLTCLLSACLVVVASVQASGSTDGGKEQSESCSGLAPHTVDTGNSGPRYTEVLVEVEKNGATVCRVYRVYLITYTTDFAHKGFCTMAASAVASGFRLNVLGEGTRENFAKETHLYKLWSLKQFVDELFRRTGAKSGKRTIIMFLDAYDVLVTGSPSALVKRFLKTEKKVLFSSEQGCCSYRESIMYKQPKCDPRWIWPETETHSPYLNSGAFVGFLPQIVHMLQAAKDERESYAAKVAREIRPFQDYKLMPPENPGPWDPYIIGGDQQLICHVIAHYAFGEGHEYEGRSAKAALKMGIDYSAKLFLSAYTMQVGRAIQFSKNRRVAFNGRFLACQARILKSALYKALYSNCTWALNVTSSYYMSHHHTICHIIILKSALYKAFI